MKQKGMVMKVQDGFCFVLTRDKQFIKLPLPPDTEIGQEIEWIIPEATVHKTTSRFLFGKRKRWTPIAGIVASVLLVIGVWQGYSIFQTPQAYAYAYVSVDINPSVEFTIDQKGQVFEQDGWNADGTTILSKLSTMHKPIQTAIQSLFQVAKQEGYLDKNKDVLITTIPATDSVDSNKSSDNIQKQQQTDAQSIANLESSLVSEVQHTLTGTSVHVKGLTLSKQVQIMARKLHLSPGKLAVFLQAQSQGIPLSIDEVKQEPIAKIISEHKELMGVYDRLNANQVDALVEMWNKKQRIQSEHKTQMQNQEDKSNSKQINHEENSKNIKNGKTRNSPKMENGQMPRGDDQHAQPNHEFKYRRDHTESHNEDKDPPEKVDLGHSTSQRQLVHGKKQGSDKNTEDNLQWKEHHRKG